jgi:amidophosphoribosyltransferase
MNLESKEQFCPQKNIFLKQVRKTHIRCQGAYAVVALITGFGLLAFRDPRGIRPLVIGVKDGSTKKEYIVASENASFTALGFKTLRDVHPGEAVFIDVEGNLHSDQCSENIESTPCIFEYVYLARPDSTLDEISVYKARMRMGQKLAKKILKLNPNHDIDVVIPIPDSSTTAALQLAAALNLPYRQGFR